MNATDRWPNALESVSASSEKRLSGFFRYLPLPSQIKKAVGTSQELQHYVRDFRIELAALVLLNLADDAFLRQLFPVNPV